MHHLAGHHSCNPCAGYWSRCWPKQAFEVCIFLAHTVFVRTLAKHDHRNHQALPLGSQTYTGDLTYYGPGLGACGVASSDNDDIVSISHFTFDAVSTGSNPNANPLCGHKLRAVRNGNSVDLTVVDRCKCTVLRQSDDRSCGFNQHHRRRLRAHRHRRQSWGFRKAGQSKSWKSRGDLGLASANSFDLECEGDIIKTLSTKALSKGPRRN